MRFHSRYNANKDEWRLEVHSVQKHDSGRYECQVNTQPVRSFFVQLNVVGKYTDIKRQLYICTHTYVHILFLCLLVVI